MSRTTYMLKDLLHYYRTNRGIGHTRVMREGTNNVEKAAVLVANIADGRYAVGDRKGIVTVTIDSLESLRGSQLPLVWDNSGTDLVLSLAINAMEDAEDEIDDLRQELWRKG